MMSTPEPDGATALLRAARDQLVQQRDDLQVATEAFAWPDVGPVFNWGIDWFDQIARGNHQHALIVLEEDGSRITRTFDEMTNRSDQLGS